MNFAVDLKEYFYLFVILNKQRSDTTKSAKFQSYLLCLTQWPIVPWYRGTMKISLF